MADRTKIEWTDASWNPVRARNIESGGIGHFCVHASPGCANCYAERMQPRFGNRVRFAAQDRGKVELFLDEHTLTQPLRWKRSRMIFVCSMTDLFADFVPDELIDRVFAVMALCPQHTFQVLTKRSKRMREYFSDPATHNRVADTTADTASQIGHEPPSRFEWPLPNVWLGVSVEDQARADERIPDLLATPAAVRWISAEPLLGPVDLVHIHEVFDGGLGHSWESALNGKRFDVWGDGPDIEGCAKLDWIVCGGESGPGARPMHPDWARSLRDQCAAAGVPFFFKQWGEWAPPTIGLCSHFVYRDGRALNAWDDAPIEEGIAPMTRVGKKLAGRLLDGVTHDAMPVQSSAA